MKKINSPKITTIILIIFSLILSYFIFKNIFSFIVLVVTVLSMVYANGYYKYSYFSKQKTKILYDVRMLFKFLPIYDVKFCETRKVEKSDYILVFLIVPILLIMILFTINPIAEQVLKYNIINKHQYNSIKWSAYVSFLYIFILLFEDLKNIKELIYEYNVIFIDVSSFEITKKHKNNESKAHHKDIFLMEYAYSKYTIIDLKREKIRLEGKLEKAKKPSFYDTYTLPLIVVFVTGILSLVNTYIATFMFNNGKVNENINNLGEALISYTIIAILVLGIVLIICSMIKSLSFNDIGDLKSRILVIEDMIRDKGKEQNGKKKIII